MKTYKLSVTHTCERCGKSKEISYKDPVSLNGGHNLLPKGWDAGAGKVLCKACYDGLREVIKEYMGDKK